MFTFEWTFRAGDILTFLGGLVVAGAFLYRRGRDDATTTVTLRALTVEITELKTQFKTFGTTLTQVAGQEIKINLLMKWYDELRHGRGFVRGEAGIEHEFP